MYVREKFLSFFFTGGVVAFNTDSSQLWSVYLSCLADLFRAGVLSGVELAHARRAVCFALIDGFLRCLHQHLMNMAITSLVSVLVTTAVTMNSPWAGCPWCE